MPFLNIGDTSLHYTVKGEGTPIIFIHPPLLTSANFVYQLEGLSKTYKVITFDIRGHGRSGASERTITYPLIVEDIECLMDHLGVEKAYIGGYSTGGSIVLEFLLMNAGRALGGIIISGMSEANDLYLKFRISLAAKIAAVKAIPFLSFAITWGNSDNQYVFRNMYKEAVQGNAKNIQQYYRYSLQYNCTERLHHIHLPILLVYGKKDKSFHQYAALLHDKLPYNQLVFLENEKHQIPTKAASKLQKMIDEFIHIK